MGQEVPMSFSQAEQFEQFVTNQLSKWIGATPVVMPIFKRLNINKIVDAHCAGKEEICHGKVVTTLAINRLLSPRPLYKVSEWLKGTILEDTLAIEAEQMYDSRLGRTLDDIYPHLEAIWQDIVVQAILEYDIDLRFLHYDITSIYFEGEYKDSDTINYGYSRDNRPDAKQVNLGINVTGKTGIPLAYRVLTGRTADRTTPLENMKAVQKLMNRVELAERANDFLLVSDRAMLDRAIIVAYEGKGVKWLGPLSANGGLQDVLESVTNEELEVHPLDYRPVSQPADEPPRYYGVILPATIESEGQEVPIQVLVVKSCTKIKLDRDRRDTYLKRLINRLEEIKGMLNSRRYKRKAYTQKQIDKALQGNPAKRFVDIELAGVDDNLTLTYQVNEEKLVEAEALDGRYLLGTNQDDLNAHQMLRYFKRQEVVERRIKNVKGPIQIRPMFLHKEERIEGLVFVTMLALLVYTILEMLCRRAGEHITARQVLVKFELLGATYTQFGDGSWLKLPSVLNDAQRQLIELLRFPPPTVYFKSTEAMK
jgi:transposase